MTTSQAVTSQTNTSTVIRVSSARIVDHGVRIGL